MGYNINEFFEALINCAAEDFFTPNLFFFEQLHSNYFNLLNSTIKEFL